MNAVPSSESATTWLRAASQTPSDQPVFATTERNPVMLDRSRTKARPPRLRAAVTASSAVVCLALAACSGGGGSASDSTGSGGTTSIKFGDLSPNSSLTPFYVAVYNGFFKKAGLDVTIQKFQGGGSSSTAALATGAVQVASGGSTNFIGNMARKVIGGKLIGETADSQYDVIASKDITDVSQLKGKNIGVSGANSADNIFLRAVLAHYGITDKDVTYITAGPPAARMTALSAGSIQATANISSFRQAELQVGNVLIKAENSPVSVPNVVFWADSSYIKSNPAVLKNFVKTVAQAAAWTLDPANLQGAISACEKGSGSTAEQCQETITTNKSSGPYTWSKTFALNTKGIQSALSAAALSIPEAKSLKLADVIDTSIAGTTP